MNSTKLIDDACIETIAKYKREGFEDNKINKYIKEGITRAVQDKYFNFFTRNNSARQKIATLGNEGIYFELLKHIVKLDAFHLMKGNAVILASKTSLKDPEIKENEAMFLLMEVIKNEGFEELQKYFVTNPKLFEILVSSFVDERYKSGDALKRQQLDSYHKEGLEHEGKIECSDSRIEVPFEVAEEKNNERGMIR